MYVPPLTGVIDRRMLVNFAADPEVVRRLIPAPFRPQVYNGRAIVGICLIRLKQMRPKGLPAFLGISSENGAHRFAIEWEDAGTLKKGVYIPRRDTSSYLNAFAGNRFFPGHHFHAAFTVRESEKEFVIQFNSSDSTSIYVKAHLTDHWTQTSVFKTLGDASEFFRGGSVGYSPRGSGYDGIKLDTVSWHVKPLEVAEVYSSYFNDTSHFPKGSVHFDNALLMQHVLHEWEGVSRIHHCP